MSAMIDEVQERRRETRLAVPRIEAERRLRGQIEKGNALLTAPSSFGSHYRRDQFRRWDDYNVSMLRWMFTNNSFEQSYLESEPYSYDNSILDTFGNIDRTNLARGRLEELQSILEQLDFFEEAVAPALPESIQERIASASGSRVFVVHGHDEEAKLKVVRFLRSLDLDPIILDMEPNRGRTIIEKLEECGGGAFFTVVILTPDDNGKAVFEEDSKPRARQNVIFELGFFVARLGRERVVALYSEGVELPSDFHGVLYIPLNDDDWQTRLAREMHEIGIQIDLDAVMRQSS